MKKKIFATLLCVAMGTSLLAGCGSGDKSGTDAGSSAGSSDGETIKIGVELYDPSDDQAKALISYFDYLEKNMNVEFVYSEALADGQAELDFINSCASKGCKGIFGYYNVTEGEAVNACIDNEMYYWGTQSIYDEFKDEEYYTGCYTLSSDSDENGDYIGGYELGYSLGKAGVKHAFYCNGGASMGIPMFVDRQNGFIAGIEAAQKDGCEIQFDASTDIVEGWPDAADFGSALQAKISGDYDGAAASFNAAALFEPLGKAGKLDGSFKISTIGEVCDTYKDLMAAGTIASVVYDCEEVVFGCGVTELVAAINGNRLTDADGHALQIESNRWVITDSDTYNAIYDYHAAGNFFVTADDVKDLVTKDGSDVNDFYKKFTAEHAVEVVGK